MIGEDCDPRLSLVTHKVNSPHAICLQDRQHFQHDISKGNCNTVHASNPNEINFLKQRSLLALARSVGQAIDEAGRASSLCGESEIETHFIGHISEVFHGSTMQ